MCTSQLGGLRPKGDMSYLVHSVLLETAGTRPHSVGLVLMQGGEKLPPRGGLNNKATASGAPGR